MLPSRVVVGIAADVSSGNTKTTTAADASGTSAKRTTVFDSETVRGRLGYAFDNVLLYGTGGWAWSSDQFIRTQLTGTLNLATRRHRGGREQISRRLDGWRRGGVRLRAKLERCSPSIAVPAFDHPLWRCRSRSFQRRRPPA